MSVEYTVDAHAGPRLNGEGEADAQNAAAVGANTLPLLQPPAPGWTPQEIESQLMGLWFFGWVAVCLVRWRKPEFAVHFAARPGEFTASATALVPVFDQYMPKAIGGPGGVLFAAPVVAGEVIAAIMRRAPLLDQGPPPETAKPTPGTVQQPAQPDDSPGSGAYKIPGDLVPPPSGNGGGL